MQAMKGMQLAVAISIACFGMTALAAHQPKIKQAMFKAQVTVDTNGHPTIGEIAGVSGALANAVRSQLAVRRYVPAHMNGVAVSATTFMTGSMLMTPLKDDSYSIGLDNLSLAPAFTAATAIPYPIEMARNFKTGSVELKLRIGRDGSATVLSTVMASGAAFEKAARDSVKAMRFKPQVIGGEPVEVDIDLPFWFHGTWSETKPVFRCEWDEKRPRPDGADGCLDLIYVIFSTERRHFGLP